MFCINASVACLEFKGEDPKGSGRRPFVRLKYHHACVQTSTARRKPFRWMSETLALPVDAEAVTLEVEVVETRQGGEHVLGSAFTETRPFTSTACLEIGGRALVTVLWETSKAEGEGETKPAPYGAANDNNTAAPCIEPGMKATAALTWLHGEDPGLILSDSLQLLDVEPASAAALSGLSALVGSTVADVDGIALQSVAHLRKLCAGRLSANMTFLNTLSPTLRRAKVASRAEAPASPKYLCDGEEYVVAGKNGATVREEERLSSKVKVVLPCGRKVQVAHTKGRRAFLIFPCRGWVSVEDAAGHMILVRSTETICCECRVRIAAQYCSDCARMQCRDCCEASHASRAAFKRHCNDSYLTMFSSNDRIQKTQRRKQFTPKAFIHMRELVGLKLRTSTAQGKTPHAWESILDDMQSPDIVRKIFAYHRDALQAQELEVCMDNVVIVLWGSESLDAILGYGRIVCERVTASTRSNLKLGLEVTEEEALASLHLMKRKNLQARAMLASSESLSAVLDIFWSRVQPYTVSLHAAFTICLLQLFLPGISYNFSKLLAVEEAVRMKGVPPKTCFIDLLLSTAIRWCDSVFDMIKLCHVLLPIIATALKVQPHLHDTEPLVR